MVERCAEERRNDMGAAPYGSKTQYLLEMIMVTKLATAATQAPLSARIPSAWAHRGPLLTKAVQSKRGRRPRILESWCRLWFQGLGSAANPALTASIVAGCLPPSFR